MPSPKDPSKLPVWWRPNRTKPRNVYEIVGHTYAASNTVLTIVARNEIEAAKISRDQFYLDTVLSVTLKLEGVWVPERL